MAYLDRVDPVEAGRARERYSCCDQVGGEGQVYGYGLATSKTIPCENEVVTQLIELRRRPEMYLRRDGWIADDEYFFAEQNARLVLNAEEYYQQQMYRAEVSSWGLRDRHMAGTLDALFEHLDGQVALAKIVAWEHNSHVGDARATEMGRRGQLNVGRLARQCYGFQCALVGVTTFEGTVTAATDWGGPAERKRVGPALPDSYEALFHETGITRFWLQTSMALLCDIVTAPRLERAIGVIYRPQTERQSHYFGACLAEQFDAVVHLDHTWAIEPIEGRSLWDREPPETFPSGI